MNKSLIIFTILAVFMFSIPIIALDSDNQAEVRVLSNQYLYTNKFNANVTASLKDLKLYNGQLALSYHIYLKDMKSYSRGELMTDSVAFENERFPLIVDENGNQNMDISINLKKLHLKNNGKVYIVFDIVDAQNNYWYLGNGKINFKTSQIVVEENFLKHEIATIWNAFINRKGIFIGNAVFLVVATYLFYSIRRKEKKLNEKW